MVDPNRRQCGAAGCQPLFPGIRSPSELGYAEPNSGAGRLAAVGSCVSYLSPGLCAGDLGVASVDGTFGRLSELAHERAAVQSVLFAQAPVSFVSSHASYK